MATNKTIEELTVKIKTEGTDKLTTLKGSFGDLKRDAESFGQSGGALGNTINGIVGKLGPLGIAASVAGVAFVSLGARALEIVDQLSDLSDATGISASTLLSFKQSLIAAGGGMDAFEKLSTKLSVSIGSAATGNEAYQQSFKKLGVFVRDSNGNMRGTETVLQDTIAALAKIEDPAVRAALAVSIMGKEAAKIDWSKVSAGKDAVTDEQIAQLNKYNDAIKEMKASIETGLVKAFGNLAEAINHGGWIEGLAAGVEEMGKLVAYIPGLGIMNDLVAKAKAERMGERAGQGRGGRGGPTAAELAAHNGDGGGDYGEAGPALIASRKRIEQSLADAQLSTASIGMLQMSRLTLSRDADIAKARIEIYTNEKLEEVDKEKEFAAKKVEINAKASLAIADLQKAQQTQINASKLNYTQLIENFSRGNIEAANLLTIQTRGIGLGEDATEMYTQQEAIISKSRMQIIALQQEAEKVKLTLDIDPTAQFKLLDIERAIAGVTSQTEVALATNKSYVAGLQEMRNSEVAYQFALGLTNTAQLNAITAKSEMIGLTSTENEKLINAIKLQKELAIAQRIQEEQSKLGRKDGEIVPLKTDRIAEIRKQVGGLYDEQTKQAEASIEKSREFSVGWEKAYKQYAENATNAAEQARTMFSTVTRSFEDAMVNFVKTGKLSFKDFANSVIEQFVRIQAQKVALGLFGGSGADSAGGIFGAIMGRATGGPVSANTPYIIGEKGPELFVPNGSGTVIPNHQLNSSAGGSGGSTNIVYNINAADAQSFRQMIARDPEFLYAVTEKGRSSIPTGRR